MNSGIYMYIGIGYILVLDIFCQLDILDIFCQLDNSANNWQIFSDIGYILPTIGSYSGIGYILPTIGEIF